MKAWQRDMLILFIVVCIFGVLVVQLVKSFEQLMPLNTVEEFHIVGDANISHIVKIKSNEKKDEDGNKKIGYNVELVKNTEEITFASLEQSTQLAKWGDAYTILTDSSFSFNKESDRYLTVFYTNKEEDIVIPKMITYNTETETGIYLRIIALPKEQYIKLNKEYIYKMKQELPSLQDIELANKKEKANIISTLEKL